MKVHVLGVPVDRISLEQASQRAVEAWRRDGDHENPLHIVTVNPEMIMAAQADRDIMAHMRAADLVVADGIGVVWAARRLGASVPGRVPGIELAEAIVQEAARDRRSVYLIGGRPGVAQDAAAAFHRRWPQMTVVGTQHGYFSPEQESSIVEDIGRRRPDVLLAGLGAPRQEAWLLRHRERLHARVMIGVGGALDVWSGRARRAPEMWRRLGLEWMYRLVTDPRRIRRMAALPRFVLAVLRASNAR